MLKHKKKLVFICTCEEWNNIVEVDTTKSTPKLEYKGKCDTVTIPGDEWNQFNFIPIDEDNYRICLLYTSPSPRDRTRSRMPSSA